MKLLRWIPIALALASCADYKGPSRAFDGSFSTLTVDVDGHSSTYNREELPLGYLRSGDQQEYSTYSNSAEAGISATGLAAVISACEADPGCIEAAVK